MIGLIGLSGLAIRLVALLLVMACAGAMAAAQAPALADALRAQFAATLTTAAERADGVVGYVVIDVTSGDRFARLEEIVHARRAQPAADIVQAIVDAVEGFRGDQPQGDDMTVVVVKITG